MAKDFWPELWDEYCTMTHLHGFHEMHQYKDRWNRGFWAFSILGGMAFSILLVIKGIMDLDPVVTLVTANRTAGQLDSFRFLYCPADWLDRDKLSEYNATEGDLIYALSSLREKRIFSRIPFFLNEYKNVSWVDDVPDMKLEINWPVLFSIAARYLEGKPVPSRYTHYAKGIFEKIKKDEFWTPQTEAAQKDMLPFEDYAIDNDALENLFLVMMSCYLQNATEALYDTIFKYFFLGYFNNTNVAADDKLELHDLAAEVYPKFDLYGENKTDGSEERTSWLTEFLLPSVSYRGLAFTTKYAKYYGGKFDQTLQIKKDKLKEEAKRSKPFGCVTLEALDSYSTNQTRDFNCSRIFEDLRLGSLNVTLSRRQRWVEFLLLHTLDSPSFSIFNRHFHSFWYPSMLKLAQQDPLFSKFVGQYGQAPWDTRKALSEYLTQSSNITEFHRLIGSTDMKFLDYENRRFASLLHKHGFRDAFDFLLAMSVDYNRFIVMATQEPNYFDAYPSRVTVAKKIMTGRGTCFKFFIGPHQKPVDRFVPKAAYLPIDHFLPLKQFYVQIIPLYRPSSLFSDPYFGETFSIIAFGDEANDLIPGLSMPTSSYGNYEYDRSFVATTFKIPNKATKHWWTPVIGFDITSIEYQEHLNVPGSPCFPNHKDNDTFTYTYHNCLLTCYGSQAQPQLVDAMATNGYTAAYPIYCYYPHENLAFLLPKSFNLKPCSDFTFSEEAFNQMEQTTGLYTSIEDIEGYLSRTFDFKKTIACRDSCLKACSSQSMKITQSEQEQMDPDTQIADDMKVPLDLSNWSEPEPDQLFTFRSYQLEDLLQHLNLSTRSRIVLKIDTDSTLYQEKNSFTWDTVLGVVGGQFGLVTGASCLTFIQLFWVFLRSIRKYCQEHGMGPQFSLKRVIPQGLVNALRMPVKLPFPRQQVVLKINP